MERAVVRAARAADAPRPVRGARAAPGRAPARRRRPRGSGVRHRYAGLALLPAGVAALALWPRSVDWRTRARSRGVVRACRRPWRLERCCSGTAGAPARSSAALAAPRAVLAPRRRRPGRRWPVGPADQPAPVCPPSSSASSSWRPSGRRSSRSPAGTGRPHPARARLPLRRDGGGRPGARAGVVRPLLLRLHGLRPDHVGVRSAELPPDAADLRPGAPAGAAAHRAGGVGGRPEAARVAALALPLLLVLPGLFRGLDVCAESHDIGTQYTSGPCTSSWPVLCSTRSPTGARS